MGGLFINCIKKYEKQPIDHEMNGTYISAVNSAGIFGYEIELLAQTYDVFNFVLNCTFLLIVWNVICVKLWPDELYRVSRQLFESDDWIHTKYVAYLLLSSRDNNNAILRGCSIQMTDDTRRADSFWWWHFNGIKWVNSEVNKKNVYIE